MIKTLIVEDESNARNSLKRMLEIAVDDVEVVGETTSIRDSLNFLKKQKVDLVFLDIELEDGNSLNMLLKLGRIPFKIIFTTAFNAFAIQAFKFNAIDYLLKPVDPDELKEAVVRAKSEIHKEELFDELLQIAEEKKQQKIKLKTSDQTFILNVNEIVRLEADGAYTHFYTANQHILISKNLSYYQKLLTDYHFVRVHKSHLVNLTHIKKLFTNSLHLSNADDIPVSTRRKQDLLASLKEFEL